jgi:L-threonylcarbamoyladenylate synthase
VKKIIDTLNQNGVILSATDTVYGLLANANSIAAVNKIYTIKNRDSQKPLAIFCKNVEQIKQIAEISIQTEKLLTNLLPGAFTFILKTRQPSNIELIKHFNYQTIGIRIPAFKEIQEILNSIDFPIAATSANISHKGDTSVFSNLDRSVIKNADLVLQDNCKIEKQASCVIDLTNFDNNMKFSILRSAPSESIFIEYLKKDHNS